MQFGSPRGAERIYIKDGVMRDGRIVARQGPLPISTAAPIRGCRATPPSNARRTFRGPTRSRTSTPTSTASTPTAARRPRCAASASRRSTSRSKCQMDKLAHLVGMDPMEFRILNAYRDGDMKAHRREAKNTALIECVQVAAEKANWPLRETAQAASSLRGGGGARARDPATVTDESGRIGRPETRHAPPQLPPGTRTAASLSSRRPRVPSASRRRRISRRHRCRAIRRSRPPPRRRRRSATAGRRLRRRRRSTARRASLRLRHEEALRWPGIADAAWPRSTIRSA